MTDDVVDVSADEVAGSNFDEQNHMWTLRTRDEKVHCARVVIAHGPAPVVTGRDGEHLEPYLGVAMHGLPNYFLITGPDTRGQRQYIDECLALMARCGSTRIEVRGSTQRVFNDRGASRSTDWRRMRKHMLSAFDLTSATGVEDVVYDGPAVVGDNEREVRVRLTGHLDPIDGRYHWQGMVFEAIPDDARERQQPLHITIGGRTAQARITERTPWDSYSVAGVGEPPFALPAL